MKDRAAVPWAVAAAGLGRLSGIADGAGVTVAVIDSGVRPLAALAGRVVSGYDLLGSSDGRVDCVGHGTAVASVIAAAPTTGVGFRGVAPGATILPLRVSDAELIDGAPAGPATDGAGLSAAIRDAVRRHAQVLNLSLVLGADVPAVRSAVAAAITAGVVVVASVGNRHATTGPDPVPYPAAYPGVIGVGSIDADGTRSATSEVGPFVDVVAPGGSITASRLPTGLAVFDGTSFAVPYVAATAALIRQALPDLSGAQVAARILATADPPVDGGTRDAYGHGVADPYRAVTEVLPAAAPPAGSSSGSPGATAGPSHRPGPAAPVSAAVVDAAAPGRDPAVAWGALAIALLALVAGGLAVGAARRDGGRSGTLPTPRSGHRGAGAR